MGDDYHLDRELRCVSCEEGPDTADVVVLRVQDSLSSRNTPRFHGVDEGDTVMSLMVTDRSM